MEEISIPRKSKKIKHSNGLQPLEFNTMAVGMQYNDDNDDMYAIQCNVDGHDNDDEKV